MLRHKASIDTNGKLQDDRASTVATNNEFLCSMQALPTDKGFRMAMQQNTPSTDADLAMNAIGNISVRLDNHENHIDTIHRELQTSIGNPGSEIRQLDGSEQGKQNNDTMCTDGDLIKAEYRQCRQRSWR